LGLNEVWVIGKAAHPSVDVAPGTFVAQFASFLPGVKDPDAEDVRKNAADLYLVVGALLGLPAALAVLERDYFVRVRGFVARIDRRPEFGDEVAQQLRERLLSPTSRRLSDYAARGPLLAWLRVAARRLAIDVQRSAGVEERHLDATPGVWESLAGGQDPEWEVLRARYREPVESAIRSAIAALSSRDRMVLRLYLFGGENIERIGKTYGVHRATVARWITTAQERIVAAVRAELGARFGIAEPDCDSLARNLRSRLNLSLAGLL
jgi:RNA polymerase sigma-70 factor, ECF subfamily